MLYSGRATGYSRPASFRGGGGPCGDRQCLRSGGPQGGGDGGTPGPETEKPQRHPGSRRGWLALISLGPGDPAYLAPQALELLQAAEVVIGYKTYLELIQPLLRPDQEVSASGMRGEIKRAQTAITAALGGRRVALVSSGDVGIYGMAGLVLEICREQGLRPGPRNGGPEVDLPLEIVPGIPALAAAAALLGAPLMHDFAAISLSDLLTPWEVIERRVQAAGAADFVLVLYNPKSSRRDWQLARVQEILLALRAPATPVGIVIRAMRAGQTVIRTDLAHLTDHPIDMQTIIIVGNSQTYNFADFLVTPRGYLQKYDLQSETL